MSIVTRRSFLGAVVVVVAGAAGVTAEFVRHPRRSSNRSSRTSPSTRSPVPAVPPVLARALTRERELLSRLDEASSTTPALRGRLTVLRADHRAHVDALNALITAAGAAPTSSVSATAPTTTPLAAHASSAAQVLALEKASAAAAALDCPSATGSAAAVLASIYACEQTHVAWLT